MHNIVHNSEYFRQVCYVPGLQDDLFLPYFMIFSIGLIVLVIILFPDRPFDKNDYIRLGFRKRKLVRVN